MNYVYIKSEPGLWTVGFYDSNGKWQPESDFNSTEDAANRVSFLNGSTNYQVLQKEIVSLNKQIEGHLAFQRSVNEALNSGDGSYRP